MTQRIVLLTTSGCHLCDDACALLAELGDSVQLNKVDIAMDDALIERYGLRIPVLRSACGSELNWPFDAAELRGWLRRLEQV
ncbi:glutaredoxin family protein [Gilvimarinus japonicus]|jgi:hypothetical protein|uniref:Glutaredoxin family protein n=1 Tax=Gilvimarinus japonicus TaxID=1796469 RepID=A0ABV7HRN4_9GAMM